MKEVIYKLDEIFIVFIKIKNVNFFYNFFLNFECFTKVLKNFINDDKTNKYYVLIIKIIKAFENCIELKAIISSAIILLNFTVNNNLSKGF